MVLAREPQSDTVFGVPVLCEGAHPRPSGVATPRSEDRGAGRAAVRRLLAGTLVAVALTACGATHDQEWLLRDIEARYERTDIGPAQLAPCVSAQVLGALLAQTAGTDQNTVSYWEDMDDYQKGFEIVVAMKTCED